MKILILSPGKFKHQFIAKGVEFYISRINFYANIQVEFFKVKKEDKNLENKELNKRIKKYEGWFKILLDEKGKQYNSIEFSKLFLTHKKILFVIGGAYGVDTKIKNSVDTIISLSLLTFPHELARLILIEQIYRSFQILHSTPYHKV